MVNLKNSYLKLAKEKYPNMTEEDILKSCPYKLGLMKIQCETFADRCIDCWHGGVMEY